MPVEHVRVLLLRAKHLFVAAIGGGSTRHWRQDSRPRGSEHFPVAALCPGAAAEGQSAGRHCGPRRHAAMTAVLTTLIVGFALVFSAMLVPAAIRDARRLRAATMSGARRLRPFLEDSPVSNRRWQRGARNSSIGDQVALDHVVAAQVRASRSSGSPPNRREDSGPSGGWGRRRRGPG